MIEILESFSATIQDAGRFGWQRFGVPPSGAMDDDAFAAANRLLDNPPGAPCVEILMGRFRARALSDVCVGLAGADLGVQPWRAFQLRRDEVLSLPGGRNGLWAYLAVPGGFDAEKFFGSASVYARGGLGRQLRAGDVLSARTGHCVERFVDAVDYTAPLVARVIPGPQEDFFALEKFFESEYRVTSQIDRVGYRLDGPAIPASSHDIVSEGIAYGAIQIPEDGRPIVMMKDRPTVGGYPKIGTVLPEDTARLAQCRPGQAVRFSRMQAKA